MQMAISVDEFNENVDVSISKLGRLVSKLLYDFLKI